MKIQSYDDYLNDFNKFNLHSSLKLDAKIPNDIKNLKNIILYGPAGIGKYTQMLSIIKRYSESKLKCKKKIIIVNDKKNYIYKTSDIHIEIDMLLLGCKSKSLWFDIYNHVIDIVNNKHQNYIIVCTNFHCIHNELLEIFYSYMQNNYINYIIITEQISFLPNNILNNCRIINIPRPSLSNYNKCLNTKLLNINISDINNIKIFNSDNNVTFINKHEPICNTIIQYMLNISTLKFNNIRNKLYDILIYDLNISECIWYIINYLIINKHVKDIYISDIFNKTYQFYKLYNNNYRPIYHLERFIFYLIIKIHEF